VSSPTPKFPTQIKIGHHRYTVRRGAEVLKEERLRGRIRFDARVMEIEKESDAETAASVLHEVVHGLFNFMQRTKECDDEELIHATATILQQIIKENPVLIAWVQAQPLR